MFVGAPNVQMVLTAALSARLSESLYSSTVSVFVSSTVSVFVSTAASALLSPCAASSLVHPSAPFDPCTCRHAINTHTHALHYITLHYVTLRYVTLRYVTLRYVTLRYVTLRYVTLQTQTQTQTDAHVAHLLEHILGLLFHLRKACRHSCERESSLQIPTTNNKPTEKK